MPDPVPASRFGPGYTVGAPGPGSPAFAAASAPAPAGPAAPPHVGVNKPAAVAFVLALFLGPFVVPLTVPMGFVARAQIARSGQTGDGLVKATFVIGGIYLLATVVVIGLWLVVVHPVGVTH